MPGDWAEMPPLHEGGHSRLTPWGQRPLPGTLLKGWAEAPAPRARALQGGGGRCRGSSGELGAGRAGQGSSPGQLYSRVHVGEELQLAGEDLRQQHPDEGQPQGLETRLQVLQRGAKGQSGELKRGGDYDR